MINANGTDHNGDEHTYIGVDIGVCGITYSYNVLL